MMDYIMETVRHTFLYRVYVKYYLRYNSLSSQQKQLRAKLLQEMSKADSYEEWEISASQFDQFCDIQSWKEQDESTLYQFEYINYLLSQLSNARRNNDIHKVIHVLRSHSFRNVGNILNPYLYKEAYLTTKNIIEKFQDEVDRCLIFIKGSDQISYQKKMEFFVEMRHAIGRTALMLSGGAILGLHHVGVIKVLNQLGVLPKIIAGSSAGSIIASLLCTRAETEWIFDGENINFSAFRKRGKKYSVWRKLKRFIKEGYFMDISVLQEFMQDNLGDVTFQEAYDQTGRILNITVTGSELHDQDRLLNYLTAPNVVIWSAVCCSCSIPLVYGGTDLYCKNYNGEIERYIEKGQKFLDGSIGADLPITKLGEFFNVNCVIVSQTNPWVIPFLNNSEYVRHENYVYRRLLRFVEWMKDLVTLEIKYRILQFGKLGLLPEIINKYANVISQEYVGNITVWPIPNVWDYLKLLNNPEEKDIKIFMQKGMKRTFQKISQIKGTTRFERQIDKLYQKLKADIVSPSFIQYGEHSDFDLDEIIFEQKQISEDTNIRNMSFMIPRTKSKEELKYL